MMEVKFEAYPKYKDSGVEWLGEIPEHWIVGKLGATLKPISVKNHPTADLLSITREKGVIQREVEDDSKNHNFIPDDLSGYKLIKQGQFGMNKMKAWQGSYGVSPYTGIVSPAYYVFEFTKEVHPDFFHKAIRSKLYVSFFGSASDGVRIGQWDLSKDRMKQIPILLPPAKEQVAIASFLDEKVGKIDGAIAQKEQLIQLLNERKQIIIQNAVTKGLNPNAPMKDSGIEWIGKIPEHWEVSRVKFCSRYISKGTTPSTVGREVLSEGEIRFIKSENIVEGEITQTPKEFIDEKTNEIISRSILKANDVLFVIAGASLGKTAVLPEHLNGSNTNQAVCFIRPNQVAYSKYLEMWLQSSAIKSQIWVDAVQSAQPNLSMESLGNFAIPVPPKAEQYELLEYLKDVSRDFKASENTLQNTILRLKEYKATLINSAVTGKINVSTHGY
ncbi:restriction endonuclease subunit S [Akkermansiaceae bacterium]|nr:restriction endonuclease subunit S [Akkermansiaceae bacterium]